MVELGQKSLSFESTGVDSEFDVARVEAREELSECYEYSIDLVSTAVDVDLRALLQQPASLGMLESMAVSGGVQGVSTRKLFGIVTEARQLELHSELARYRVCLRPRLWLLSRTRRSRVFMDMSVPDIVESIFNEHGITDYTLDLQATYAAREYVVQYEETDLQFVSRWLEHAGIYYYFTQGDDVETVVLADSDAAYVAMEGDDTLAFRPQAQTGTQSDAGDGQDWMDTPEVQTFAQHRDLLPQSVTLDDYNWRAPRRDLTATADLDADGVGTIREFHNHYRSVDEGQDLARIRAEELSCREVLFHGESNSRSLRPGVTFELSDHFREDCNARYLVIAVDHVAAQDIGRGSASSGATYGNRFVAIPADRVFRPERRTPKPRIDGVVNAKIDASGAGRVADLDEDGAYRVVFPFDEGSDLMTLADGNGSRRVRLAQSFAGQNYGAHFPLLKGTEVLVAHVGGDPDRPVILGAVPNRETHTPVDSANAQRYSIRTAGNNIFEMDDQEGQRGFLMTNRSMGAIRTMRARPKE